MCCWAGAPAARSAARLRRDQHTAGEQPAADPWQGRDRCAGVVRTSGISSRCRPRDPGLSVPAAGLVSCSAGYVPGPAWLCARPSSIGSPGPGAYAPMDRELKCPVVSTGIGQARSVTEDVSLRGRVSRHGRGRAASSPSGGRREDHQARARTRAMAALMAAEVSGPGCRARRGRFTAMAGSARHDTLTAAALAVSLTAVAAGPGRGAVALAAGIAAGSWGGCRQRPGQGRDVSHRARGAGRAAGRVVLLAWAPVLPRHAQRWRRSPCAATWRSWCSCCSGDHGGQRH